MEDSSLPESGQLQQQEQQDALLQYPQQQQQQQQQYQDYYYYQTYDQSSYYCYPYYQHQYPYQHQHQWPLQYDDHHHQQQQQQQNYAYYHHQQQPGYYQQHESAPPGVSLPQISDPVGTHQLQELQQTSCPHPLRVPVSSAPAPPATGMNPAAAAAIAALEQLTQFAGTMDAAERAMGGLPPVNIPGFELVSVRPLEGQHPVRGGRRGGRPFRGGRQANLGHVRGSAPPSRGKGRVKVKARSRHVQPQGAALTSSYPEPSAANTYPSDVAVEAAQSAPAPEKVAPKHRPSQVAWCDLCKVDCTSGEILEQHKNGKRHKKNLLRIEKLKKSVKPGEEVQNDLEPVSDTKPEETQVAQDEEGQKSAENLTLEVVSDEPRVENNQQDSSGGKTEVPVEELSNQPEMKNKMNFSDNRRRAIKRKVKGDRGGKRIKTVETHRRPVEPPKPKVVIPLICDLCNVKCDTREVLDRHLSGKKHLAKLKRFQGHQASTYGPPGFQALYPPNPIVRTHMVPQGHQTVYASQGSLPPPFPAQAHHSIAAAAAGFDPRFSQSSLPQQSKATSTANPAAAVLRL